MSPEADRILRILAKYQVVLPVAAYLELGIIEERVPPPPKADYRLYAQGLTRAQMMEIARRKGRVCWLASGVTERLRLSLMGDLYAAGKHTKDHWLGVRETYNCREVYGGMTAILPLRLELVPREILHHEFLNTCC
jgi:hypothetical protein